MQRFQRVHRRVEPTATGRELLVLCEEVFRAFDRFDERVTDPVEPLMPARERESLAGALSSPG